jgi:HPt (histidine-containing phosphotransfer) domain-containing protein
MVRFDMAKKGGQPGNQNAAKGKIWSDALRLELAQDRQRLRKLIKALMDKAESGDVPALKELADRIEGKAVQPVEGTGEDGAITIKWRD